MNLKNILLGALLGISALGFAIPAISTMAGKPVHWDAGVYVNPSEGSSGVYLDTSAKGWPVPAASSIESPDSLTGLSVAAQLPRPVKRNVAAVKAIPAQAPAPHTVRVTELEQGGSPTAGTVRRID